MKDTLILNQLLLDGEGVQPIIGYSWLYVLLGVSIVICILVVLYVRNLSYRRNKSRETKQRILETSVVDFDNVINSAFAAKILYDKLKVKCHPDRFTDKGLNVEATRIFQEITKNKYDYKALLHLKEEATNKLKVNI